MSDLSSKRFDIEMSYDDIRAQYEQEKNQMLNHGTQKTKFDAKNYLNARLAEHETTKTIVIRLLPFDPESKTPFKKVHMHTVKVNKEVSPSGWKTFVCPINNKVDGSPMGDACPFCETSKNARELKRNSLDERTKKQYGDVEFSNKVREMWIVRCIERGHEEDGAKFWLFNSSKKMDGVHDKIMNLAKQRSESAKRKGNDYSIFDLNNGMDLMLTLNKTPDGKTSIQIIDEGMPSPLSDDYEKGLSWINDQKKWNEVYTVKPYDYMRIVLEGGVPVFLKDAGKYVNKNEADSIEKEAEAQRISEAVKEVSEQYAEEVSMTDDGDDLPF